MLLYLTYLHPAKSQAGKAKFLKKIRRWGVGIFYFDKEKAARYSALSVLKKGSIPTGFIHDIDDDGEKSSGKSDNFEKNPQKGTENGGTERIFLHVHEVFTAEEIREFGSQQTDATPAEAGRIYRNASEFYLNILSHVLNVKRENF